MRAGLGGMAFGRKGTVDLCVCLGSRQRALWRGLGGFGPLRLVLEAVSRVGKAEGSRGYGVG